MLVPSNPKKDVTPVADPKERLGMEHAEKAGGDSSGYRFNMWGKVPDGEGKQKNKAPYDTGEPVSLNLSEEARKFLAEQETLKEEEEDSEVDS